MKRTIEQLVASLDKANEIYAELIDIAKEKRSAIKNQEIERLDKYTNHEMGLVAALYKLEEIRAKIIDRLIQDYGMLNVKNLSQLAQNLDEDERKKVIDAKNRLIIGIKNISDETKFNNRLLEDKIALIDLSLQMLTDAPEDDGYGSKGEQKSIMDLRV